MSDLQTPELDVSGTAYLTLVQDVLLGRFEPHSELVAANRDQVDVELAKLLKRRGLIAAEVASEDAEWVEEGLIWPRHAMTMIGRKRLQNIRDCVVDAVRSGVPGDLIETGVWRGGGTIFMRAILRVLSVRDRRVWVADSFAGLPRNNPESYPADQDAPPLHLSAELSVSLEQVESNFELFGLLDGQVRFLKGWFKDTLPTLGDQRWAVMRLDGDLYESTIQALTNLYPNLAVGGWTIIDDYGEIDACKQAVHDYRRQHEITEPLEEIDGSGVCWKRVRGPE